MNKKIKSFLVSIGIPLIIGGLAALLSRGSTETYSGFNLPSLSPPAWLFPIVWTVLYLLIGIASYLVFSSSADQKKKCNALTVYGIQLIVNFLWPIFFFNFGNYGFSFVWILILWVLIFVTVVLFYNISKPSAYLLIPYLLWVTYAAYLNLQVFLLN